MLKRNAGIGKHGARDSKAGAGIGKHGRDAPKPCHDSHRPRHRIGGIPGRRIGADAIRAADHPSAVGRGDQRSLVHPGLHPAARRSCCAARPSSGTRCRSLSAVGLVFPGRADDSHLRLEPRARPGGDRRARQSVAAAFGRGRGPAAARAAPRAAIRRADGGRARRADHHRHAHRRHARLAHLGAAAAARRVGDARHHSAGHQGRAGNLAEPDRRRPDRLHRLDADGPHGGAHPHRPLHGAGAVGRQAVVRAAMESATASARCCSMRRSAPDRSRWSRRCTRPIRCSRSG